MYSSNAFCTGEANVTLLAPLATGSWRAKRPFGTFDSHCPSIATGSGLPWSSFGPRRTLLSRGSTASYRASVTLAPSQSNRSFVAGLAPVPFGPGWSRSPC
ncbi:hypothetical protein EYF80_029126 [Liparis tanakae]|uniref:Uncharacterized protein n=1 Tax=Liparis tanakae TaxID=230148 RepID=A0A4Z2H6L2_9TELE|nr:hypothetical protein EYF80_029126 [Liparis tanakae]